MQTFRDRLKILMGNDRPYTWARKVGIEKGLFQYYWQKRKIPTYLNLIKIQNYSGCSLDWLLTGKTVDFSKVKTSPTLNSKGKAAKRGNAMIRTIKKIKDLYKKKSDKDIDHLEHMLDVILHK